MKDTLTISTIAGIISTVVMHLLSMIWKAFGLIKVTSLQTSAAIFLSWNQVNTTTGYIVGVISHLIIGVAGAVLLAYFIKFSGKDYYWLKGLALAGLMSIFGMGFIVRLLEIVPQMKNDSLTTLLHILNFVIYGLLSSYIIAKYARYPSKI